MPAILANIEACTSVSEHYPASDILNILPRSCQDPRSYQDFQDPRSCQDIQDEIQDFTKKFKMSRQNLRSWQDIQDVERWVLDLAYTKEQKNTQQIRIKDLKRFHTVFYRISLTCLASFGGA